MQTDGKLLLALFLDLWEPVPIANKFNYSFRDRLAQRDACDEVSVAIEMHAFGRGMGEVMVSQNRLVTNGQIAVNSLLKRLLELGSKHMFDVLSSIVHPCVIIGS